MDIISAATDTHKDQGWWDEAPLVLLVEALLASVVAVEADSADVADAPLCERLESVELFELVWATTGIFLLWKARISVLACSAMP